MNLNGATLIRGDRYDMSLSLTNLDSLVLGHPLKASGLQTSGYSLRLVAKPGKGIADDNALTINLPDSRFTITSSTAATYVFLPSDTSDIVMSSNTVVYLYDIQIASDAEPENYTYTTESGSFILSKDVAISAP